MKVLIITQDENIYLPLLFKRIIPSIKDELVGITILSENKSKVKIAKKYLNFYRPYLFFITLMQILIYKVSDRLIYFLPIKNVHSVRRISQIHGVDLIGTNNINSQTYIDTIKELQVELVISVASPQIFKKAMINTPSKGCINIHGAPLPKYRGMLPSFWMLFNNEKIGAVTVHYIDEGIDSGDIILQREYEIPVNISHHDLMIKSKLIGADLLVEAIDLIRNDKVERKKNDASKATYYSFPDKEDMKRFFRLGKRLR